ncbi:MAG: RpiB/LacA/LacB family sugar-phosphate isomerase [Chloroflexi bacterium]|nr:RpiB/LacA/LacB family sugar-phosphate isomerase [Chloroflexota bacterium]
MRVAVGSDAKNVLADVVVSYLVQRGIEAELHGALRPGDDANWPTVATAVAKRVAQGTCQQGILFCWTGTGVSIAANKIPGARAALCADAATAAGARRWNDANILCMSLRLTSPEVGKEILEAWLTATPEESERENIQRVKALDRGQSGPG